MMNRRAMFPALCLACTLILLGGCAADDADGGGGFGDSGTSDVGREVGGLDLVSEPDLDAGGDAGGVDAGQDTLGQDTLGQDAGTDPTSEPDANVPSCGGLDEACCAGTCDGALVCSAGTCLTQAPVCTGEPACISPPGGRPDAPIIQRQGAPPTLTGGLITDAAYELDLIVLYTDSTVSALVDTFEVTSNGDTRGSLVFEGTEWGFEANLDLFIDASALGQSFAQDVWQALQAGGCYSAVGNQLRGDLTECGASWPAGTVPPSSLGYQTSAGGIQLLLILTREMILAAVPEQDRFLVGLAIVGDLPIVLTFSALP
jgi:hypothetical protein